MFNAIECATRRRWVWGWVGLRVSLSLGGAAELPVEIAGVTVVPQVRAAGLRYRSEPDSELGARVQLFIRNTLPVLAGTNGAVACNAVLFEGQEPYRLIENGEWAWHDTPSIWSENETSVPGGALTVWSFNTKPTAWGPGRKLQVSITDWEKARRTELPVVLAAPQVWISSLVFLSSDRNLLPNTMVIYVANASAAPVYIRSVRLYLPENHGNYRILFPQPYLTRLYSYPSDLVVPPGDKACLKVITDRLPLTYAALEVGVTLGTDNPMSLWAHQRVKSERFDISGGWVQDSGGGANTLTHEPFLQLLQRLHVNTAHLTAVPGYTDQNGSAGLYTRYPLKLFGQLEPISVYDTDEKLPFIHGVEFLGEPQNGFGGHARFPQAVWQALRPYAKTRLPTTVTLSDESTWRWYAGLSDYAHFDAYRVAAPSADDWMAYNRWDGKRLGWGAPLETLGELCRSLRELNRPAPIACWSQGPHHNWESRDDRRRTSPTPEEIRLQAYQALSSRVTSLYWFNLSLRALVQYRDTIDELTRIGREIRLLDDFYLEGDAYRFQTTTREGKPDWDLASIISPRGAVLFALDLDYFPDRDKTFQFKKAREARFGFELPAFLRQPVDVFRVDADGLYDVAYQPTDRGIEISDKQSKVAIYIATRTGEQRELLKTKRQLLVDQERSLNFDPANKTRDFDLLKAGLKTP